MRARWLIFAVLVLAVAGCGAPPAPAPAAPPTTAAAAEADLLADYLAAIEENGGGVAAVSPARLLATGEAICAAFGEGRTTDHVVGTVRAEREGYTEDEAGTLIRAATQVLCPEHAAKAPAAPAPETTEPAPAPRQPAVQPDPNDETDAGVTDPCLGPDSDPVACSDGYSDDSDMPSSGEEQFQYGCEQGYIPPEDCEGIG